MLKAPVAALVILCLAGCAMAPYAGRTEYRAGLALHTNPNFSFQMPDGWRPATGEDWLAFGANQRVAKRMNDQGRREFQRQGTEELKRYPMVLISTRGAWIDVKVDPNQQGLKYASGYVLNEAEKEALWQQLELLVPRIFPSTDRPALTLKSVEVVDYGPNTVLQLKLQREDQRGAFHWTFLGFYSERNIVTVSLLGIPDDPNEGANALATIARTFKFE